MFKRFSLAVAAAVLVAGCSSGVDLQNPAASDGTSTAIPTQQLGLNGGAQSGSAGLSGVAGVDLSQSTANKDGPANVSRLVYFDYDSYAIKPEFQTLIDAHASFIKAGQGRTVMIEGHTDERGGREYNLALGQKRAEAVRRSLGLLGVPDTQMEAVSFGKEKPAATGNSEDVHAQNRRAELSYR
ncbi:MAG: peptidoglycan-associated lipoprotein Pal [Giesbergeria sp.]|uniref:peptidoglycan-associated lipoprotein Pal n=1 Tax=Giesbergeria sp. TaxID=2818473 RepID=UPI0026054F40|nr:peptidoglycan-associated lipoprotein Pal [Giesbergeria sp.]MDD2610875.1 peptidoglycan-associated lipoprotein Pal [Giesbergeria sp.]